MKLKKLIKKYGYLCLTLDDVDQGVARYHGTDEEGKNRVDLSVHLDFSKKIKQFKHLELQNETEFQYLMSDFGDYKVKIDITVVKTKRNIK